MMIAREYVLPARLGDLPVRPETEQRSERDPTCRVLHSVRTASAMFNRLARQAGIQPAATAAAMIQTGVQARDAHGKASWIVQPKKARLITPVRTTARHSPAARPRTLAR